ncbi:MAG: O-antigen ligase family protein [Flavobacteriales bacterium]|nr:O-antigen ligase family protein [Flavobacteriales bacterium]MCB9166440.1 O-antigen ligase family protein [Flavobacteriales bacterium]
MKERPRMTMTLPQAAVLLVALQPVTGMQGTVWTILALAIVAIWYAARHGVAHDRCAWRNVLLLGLPFLLMLPDIARAQDPITGWRSTERAAALLVLPLLFIGLRLPIDGTTRRRALDLFSLAALVLMIYGGVWAIGFPSAGPEAYGGSVSRAFREEFARATGVHAVYAMYYFLTAALFQVHAAWHRERWAHPRGAVAVCLLFGAVWMASRMPVLGFLAGAIVIAVHRPRTERRLHWSLPLIALATGLVAFLFAVPNMAERLGQLIPQEEPTRSPDAIRGEILHCTIAGLEDHWLLGTGLANVQPTLDACYAQYHDPILSDGHHGTHMQAFHWWLGMGLAGLGAFALLFGRSLWLARSRVDPLHLAFVVMVLLCSFTEDLLSRQWGVVLFAYFNALFLASPAEAPARSR